MLRPPSTHYRQALDSCPSSCAPQPSGAVAISWSRGRELANYRKQLLAAEPEAFFAPDGLFVEGEYCAWISAKIYLLSASIEPTTPPCVSMLFQRVRSDAVVGIDTFA